MKIKNMNTIGNKYDITMFQWFEQLAKAEKRLNESMECQRRFGDHEVWIQEDTEKVNSIKKDIEEVKEKLEGMGIEVEIGRAHV